jgi:P27 family predicted phage terminase small subunit
MGRRGPIPDPKSERSKTGRNTRYKKTATAAGPISPPAWLAGPAADFWQAHAPGLSAAGRLTQDQAETFGILCQLAVDCQQLAAQVAAEGWVTATDKGQAISPVARLLRDSRRDFVNLAREFGMTAAAAARIPQEPDSGEEEGSEEAAILKAFTSGEA